MVIITKFLLATTIAWLAYGSPNARAEDKPVPLVKQWKGSVADAVLAEGAPSVIASAKQLENLWTRWKLADKPPEVDFTKQIVLVATTRGSHLGLSCKVSDTGDLKVLAHATADFGEGFRYVLATVSREGVKTVDGKELPKE